MHPDAAPSVWGSCGDHSSCPSTSALYGGVYGVPSVFPQLLQKMTDKKGKGTNLLYLLFPF